MHGRSDTRTDHTGNTDPQRQELRVADEPGLP